MCIENITNMFLSPVVYINYLAALMFLFSNIVFTKRSFLNLNLPGELFLSSLNLAKKFLGNPYNCPDSTELTHQQQGLGWSRVEKEGKVDWP